MKQSTSVKSYNGVIRWNGSAHLILLISKFFNKEIGISDLKTINPERFKKSNCKRELLRLEILGYIKFTNNLKTRWTITNAGYSFVYELAATHSKTIRDSHDGI